MPAPNYNRPIYYDEGGTNQSSEQRTYTDNHNNTYQAGKYDYISSLATPQQVQSVYQQYGITPKDPPKPPVDYGNTGGGGGGGGSSTSSLYTDILKKLAEAYEQLKSGQEALKTQSLAEADYEGLLGRERNNSWLKTANNQIGNMFGNENSALRNYSQARNSTKWLTAQNENQRQLNANRANIMANHTTAMGNIDRDYANTLYNLYNNERQWERYLQG